MPDLNQLNALFNAGQWRQAAALGEQLLGAGADAFAVHGIVGRARFQLGEVKQAAEHFAAAAALQPQSADAQNNLGIAFSGLGRNSEAAACFARATAIDPNSANAFNNLGFTLNATGRKQEALTALNSALHLNPNYADAYNNRGIVLYELDCTDEAIADYTRALTLNPNLAKAHNNLGNALAHLGYVNEAIAAFQRCLALDPNFAGAANNLGVVLRNAGRGREAIAFLERAIELDPAFADAYGTLGVALADLRRSAEAIAAFSKALTLDPGNDLMRAQRLFQQARLCDWDAIAADAARIPALGVDGAVVPPFAMLALEDDPARHRVRAAAFAADKFRVAPRSFSPPSARPRRLRIGYFSADVHNHAVMYLIARVLELHDRTRFEIHVFSYGPASDDETRKRVRSAADNFHDVRPLRDQDIAHLARDRGIDVAIDLNAYTRNGRLGIFANRAAPLQINYLGYPGTSGAPFIDYIIADPVLIPPSAHRDFSEQVIALPHCYQPNDDRRPIADATPSRQEAGLPERGVVFCCFNNSYKITSAEFDVWAGLLRQVDGSVLWLLKCGDVAEANLRREAAQRGVDPSRLSFAPSLPLAQHLARHRLADLFLDTFTYNAHTTASDALWAGLPLVTKIGEGFAARVAASLLQAIELPELVAHTVEDYAALALGLAANPQRLAAIRTKLAANRATTPLFNSALTTRHLEAAYDAAFARYLAGSPPQSFAVAP